MTLVMPVIPGSVRSDRKGIQVAHYIIRHLHERGYTAPLVDPIELNLPLLDRMYKEYPGAKHRPPGAPRRSFPQRGCICHCLR
jgi:hypothetical protein